MTLLLNWSFETGRVPACFKEAIISPIPKKPRPSTADYRPISLLPLLSKITEKLVANYWIKPSIHGQLRPDRFAYVLGPGKGTATALTLLYHKVLEYLDKVRRRAPPLDRLQPGLRQASTLQSFKPCISSISHVKPSIGSCTSYPTDDKGPAWIHPFPAGRM